MRLPPLIHRWFVQYSPLYFVSALCVLGGVGIIAGDLEPDARRSKFALAAVSQAYELLLIAGAWILLRFGQRRPAVILALLELGFLFDIAMNGERLTGIAGWIGGPRGRIAMGSSVVFGALAAVKLLLLARVFRLRGAAAPLAVAAAALVAMPLVPYLVEFAGQEAPARVATHLGISWLGALLLGWAFVRESRSWTSGFATDDWSVEVARRIASAAPFIAAIAWAGHGVAWSCFLNVPLSPAHAAPYVLVGASAWAARRMSASSRQAELCAWAGAAVALFAAALAPSPAGLWPLAGTAFMAAAAMIALTSVGTLRLAAPAVVCLFGGSYLVASGGEPPLPAPHFLWPAGAGLALLAAALAQRDFRALLVSSLSVGVAVLLIERADEFLTPFACIAAAIWLAAWTWLMFDDLRRWLPFALTAGVLGCGLLVLAHEPMAVAPWYGGNAIIAAGVGFALRRPEWQLAGLLGCAPAALATRVVWMPHTTTGWGSALVVAGFVCLLAGLAFNLAAARRAPA